MATDGGLSLGVDPEAEYLRAVESSTCLLLSGSPSPTPPHPLANVALFSADDGSSGQLQPEDAAADSSSSGDSASVAMRHDPVSAQLINNMSMLEYRTLSKADRLVADENAECKLNGSMSASNHKLPKFVEWNWVVVRKVILWVVLSALAACTAAVVAMIATLPKSCDPKLPWYQGSLFYEVFTASFENSDRNSYGDLRGLKNKLDYIENLGARAVRLNYIYEATEYPELYTNVTDTTRIASSIGTVKDFQELVTEINRRNMSIVLDVPVTNIAIETNGTSVDPLDRTLAFWSALNVDGFYLKDLDKFINDRQFEVSLRRWKKTIGQNRILIVSYKTFAESSGIARNLLLSKVQLIDVQLETSKGMDGLNRQIDALLKGPLFTKPSYPWIHWNLGDVQSERISSRNQSDSLALILMTLSLPGTVSIFYGDEIGLQGLPDVAKDDDAGRHLIHGLVAMRWPGSKGPDGSCDVKLGSELPWNCGTETPDFTRLAIIKQAIELRKKTPTLYASWAHSDSEWRGNAAVRSAHAVVLERWLPRRHSYVYVGNPAVRNFTTDLSTSFYAGTIVAATNITNVGTYLYFDQILLRPHEAMIVKLEK